MVRRRAAERPGGNGKPQHRHRPQAATQESEALHRAAAHCNAAFAYCTSGQDGVHDLEDLLCIIDCAELCVATAGFVARGAHYAQELRDLCSQQLRDVQEKLAAYPGDEVFQSCARALEDAEDALQGNVIDAE